MVWRTELGEAYSLLERMGKETWGLSSLPRMERAEGGKPFFPDHPDCQFNVSHSRGRCLCALAGEPVGADVELVRPRSESLPGYVLDERELDWFRSRGERWEDFFTLWTLKEARVKCTGEGLRRPPRQISVPLLEPGEIARWEGFTFYALAGEDWRGAVCLGENMNNS